MVPFEAVFYKVDTLVAIGTCPALYRLVAGFAASITFDTLRIEVPVSSTAEAVHVPRLDFLRYFDLLRSGRLGFLRLFSFGCAIRILEGHRYFVGIIITRIFKQL